MLLYDNLRATDDTIKLFFMEVYELFIKVCTCKNHCLWHVSDQLFQI